jgi:hypothetical protein
MRPPLVVELHERVEAALHRRAAREVLTAKLDAPCKIVPCSRSTKPLVQAWRGKVRVCLMPRARQASAKAPLNSEPPSVRIRCSGQSARQ